MKKSGSEILFHSFFVGQGLVEEMDNVEDEQDKSSGKESRKAKSNTTFGRKYEKRR